MRCPACEKGVLRVIETEVIEPKSCRDAATDNPYRMWRRRHCFVCGADFQSIEEPEFLKIAEHPPYLDGTVGAEDRAACGVQTEIEF